MHATIRRIALLCGPLWVAAPALALTPGDEVGPMAPDRTPPPVADIPPLPLAASWTPTAGLTDYWRASLDLRARLIEARKRTLGPDPADAGTVRPAATAGFPQGVGRDQDPVPQPAKDVSPPRVPNSLSPANRDPMPDQLQAFRDRQLRVVRANEVAVEEHLLALDRIVSGPQPDPARVTEARRNLDQAIQALNAANRRLLPGGTSPSPATTFPRPTALPE